MKVLQVTAVDFTLQKFLLPLIDAMQNEGFTVEIACNVGHVGEELREKGYIIHHIPFDRNFNFLSHGVNVYKLVCLLKKNKYDCIHTHTPVASIIARLAARIARVPVIIYTAHGFYFHENMNPIAYKIAYNIEKYWGRYLTDYLFFQSIEDFELALRKKFNKPGNLLHIGNGVSANIFNPNMYDRYQLRKNMGFDEKDCVLIFVGRLVREKGIEELIQAFQKLKHERPEIKLIVAGGTVQGDRDNLNINKLLACSSEDVKKDIYLLGLRNDIPQLLSIADIFILPSYREGLPRSIIEAMAMQKPIIATNIRGCREEVEEGFNGYLCRPGDSDDLYRKLNLMLSDKDKVMEFGRNSRELFKREFDENLVLEKQLKIFRKLNTEVK